MSRKYRRRGGQGKTPPRPASSFAPPAVSDPRKNLPGEARTLIANVHNDITIPYYSGRMIHADDTLIERGGGKGLKIYDEIERDSWAGPELEKRRLQLTSREWSVKATSSDPRDAEAAEFVRAVLKSLPFDQVCDKLLGATLKGFAVGEIVWTRSALGIVPEAIVDQDQRRFCFDDAWRLRLLTLDNPMFGQGLPERKFIVHRHGVRGNNPYGLGIGSRLFWPVLFKREGVAFWLHFLDKFAGPTIVGKTPYGMLSDEQRRLLESLRSARTASAILVPIGTDVDFLEASRSGSVTYEEFLAYWDKQISICVTGETLTTDVGSAGSRAAAETHADMLGLLVDGDSDMLSGTLRETLIRWLIDYNFPGAGVPEIWRERPRDAKAEAAVVEAEAKAAAEKDAALRKVLRTAALIADDDLAREFVAASGLISEYSDDLVSALVSMRRSVSAEATQPDPPSPLAA